MAGTRAGGVKARETQIKKYGSEAAYLEFMSSIGAKGGKRGHTGGFYTNRALARIAGAKGGRISRRGPAKAKEA